MKAGDLPAVVALADLLHPHHPEAPAVFAERLALAPEGCRVLAADTGLVGYAISHPWTGQAPPRLDALLGVLPERPGAWHIHDIALAPGVRGMGLAAAALRGLLAGRVLPVTLVAIPGSGAVWARFGFRDAAVDDPAALSSYGAGARFMRRELPRAGGPAEGQDGDPSWGNAGDAS